MMTDACGPKRCSPKEGQHLKKARIFTRTGNITCFIPIKTGLVIIPNLKCPILYLH